MVSLLSINYVVTKYKDNNNLFLYLFVTTFVLDELDCNFLKPFISHNCKTHEYQKYDKIADLITYLYIYILCFNKLKKQDKILMLTLILYRLIGVYKFFKINNNKILHIYIDAINTFLLIVYLTKKMSINNFEYIILNFISILFKKEFEKYHHNKVYNIT